MDTIIQFLWRISCNTALKSTTDHLSFQTKDNQGTVDVRKCFIHQVLIFQRIEYVKGDPVLLMPSSRHPLAREDYVLSQEMKGSQGHTQNSVMAY